MGGKMSMSVQECKRSLNCDTVERELIYTYCETYVTPLVESYNCGEPQD